MSTLTATTPATMHRQLRHRAVAVTATVVTTLALWSLAVPLLEVSLTVRTPGSSTEQNVGAAAVLATSLLVSLAGWGLLALLEHHTPRARTVWTGAAATMLLVSLAGPLTAAATSAAAAWLMLLHLSVAAVLIPLLRRTTLPR